MDLFTIVGLCLCGGFIVGTIFGMIAIIMFPNVFYQNAWVEVNPEFENNILDVFKDKFSTKGKYGGVIVFRSYPYINRKEDGKMEYCESKLYVRKRFNFPMLNKAEAMEQLKYLSYEIEKNDITILSMGVC